MLHEISRLAHLLVNCDVQHVKGHQDRTNGKNNLSYLARLNIQADILANQAHLLTTPSILAPPLLSTKMQFHTPEGHTESRLKRKIQSLWSQSQMKPHLQRKHQWSDNTLNAVDWYTFDKLIKSFPHQPLHFLKFANGLFPTNSRLHCYKSSHSPCCSFCHREVETWQHLKQCESPIPTQWRQTLRNDLLSTCFKLQTDPKLTDLLLQGIDHYYFKNSTPNQIECILEHQDILLEQCSIGWDCLIQGKMTTAWNLQYQKHVKSLPPHTSYKHSPP